MKLFRCDLRESNRTVSKRKAEQEFLPLCDLTKTSALIKIPEISSNTVDPDEKVHNEHNASVRLLFLDVIAFRALCP